MARDNYTFLAIFEFLEDGDVEITFPSFDNQMTCTGGEEDPVTCAQDWLTLAVLDLEERKQEVPECDFNSAGFELSENQQIVYVNIWMPYHRSKVKEVYTKKTLTIPVWLDMLAKQHNINFSATLAEALKEKIKLQ